MSFAGERYYNINRIMMIIIGVWPYCKPILLHTMFIVSAFMTHIFFLLTPLLTKRSDMQYIMKQLSFILPNVIHFCFYNLCYFNRPLMKQLLEKIKTDWNVLEGSSDIRILEQYAVYSYYASIMSFCAILFAIFMLTTIEFVPIILDVLAPLNETRPRKLKVDFELFIDEQQYFYIYLIHEIVVVAVSFFTMAATGTILLALFGHCCATYKIASTILENTVTRDTIQISAHLKVQVMYKKIYRAVDTHRKSIQFTKVLMVIINKWFFIIMIIGVFSLSCNLLRLLNAATLLTEASELFLCIGVVYIHFAVMFASNLIGQFIINHSAEMFHAVYRTTWYVAPLSVQKLLLFIMQNSLKPDTLFIGNLYVASLEGFSTLLTTSISYFTVMYNVN